MELIIPFVIIAIIVAAVIAIVIALKNADLTGTIFEPGNRRAGRKGEEAATNIIRQVLHADDLLFTNMGQKPTELSVL